jgi:DNA-binding cell septation regulator SpoVG
MVGIDRGCCGSERKRVEGAMRIKEGKMGLLLAETSKKSKGLQKDLLGAWNTDVREEIIG